MTNSNINQKPIMPVSKVSHRRPLRCLLLLVVPTLTYFFFMFVFSKHSGLDFGCGRTPTPTPIDFTKTPGFPIYDVRVGEAWLGSWFRPPIMTNAELRLMLTQPEGSQLSALASIVQNQLIRMEESSCSGVNLMCGVTASSSDSGSCGVACQLHHRLACLMMSYSLNIPLVYEDQPVAWNYREKWTNFFQPHGAKCKPSPSPSRNDGNRTYYWGFSPNKQIRSMVVPTGKKSSERQCHYIIPQKYGFRRTLYPLSYGVPMSDDVTAVLEKVFNNSQEASYQWAVGQFIQYLLRLQPEFQTKLDEWKKRLDIPLGESDKRNPIIGLHIAKPRPKSVKSQDVNYNVDHYMGAVKATFKQLDKQSGKPLVRRVFIVANDYGIVRRVRKMYPDWEVYGFEDDQVDPKLKPSSVGGPTGATASVRNIFLLRECDNVICGYMSDTCRLVLAMYSSKYGNPQERIQVLEEDGGYDKPWNHLALRYLPPAPAQLLKVPVSSPQTQK